MSTTQGRHHGFYWPSAVESAALLRVAAVTDRLGVLRGHVSACVGMRDRWSNRRDTAREVLPHIKGAQECLVVFIKAVEHDWCLKPSDSVVVPSGGAGGTGPAAETIRSLQTHRQQLPDGLGCELRSIFQQLDPHHSGTGLEPLWKYLKRGPFEQTGTPLVKGGAPTFVPPPLPLACNALTLTLGHLHDGATIAERATPRGGQDGGRDVHAPRQRQA